MQHSSNPPHPTSPPSGGEEHENDDTPYTTAVLLKLSAALGDIAGHESPLGLAHAAEAAAILATHGLALVEPERTRMWIDERVYSGALFRLRLAEAPPSLTLPQDLLPANASTISIAITCAAPPALPPPATTDSSDPGPIPDFLKRARS